MPFTPYHFAPAGLIGLPFYKRMDLPLFVFSNVAIDVEVLVDMKFFPGLPIHGYAHTLIGAMAAGIVIALLAYPVRSLLAGAMSIVNLNYKPTFVKMLIGAILGGWFHVIVDSFCWYDVIPFWPLQKYNRFYQYLGASKVQTICLLCIIPLVICYIILIAKKNLNNRNVPK